MHQVSKYMRCCRLPRGRNFETNYFRYWEQKIPRFVTICYKDDISAGLKLLSSNIFNNSHNTRYTPHRYRHMHPRHCAPHRTLAGRWLSAPGCGAGYIELCGACRTTIRRPPYTCAGDRTTTGPCTLTGTWCCHTTLALSLLSALTNLTLCWHRLLLCYIVRCTDVTTY